MFAYAEWKRIFYFIFSVVFFSPQYYEMSYGLNIEMHKQVCEPLISPLRLYTRRLWIMYILDRRFVVCEISVSFLQCVFTFSYLCRVNCICLHGQIH